MATILFNYSSTASSTTAKVSVAEAMTVEVQATATATRPGGPVNPVKVVLNLNGSEISSSENKAASPVTATAEASVGMMPGQVYTLQVVGLPPPGGAVTNLILRGT